MKRDYYMIDSIQHKWQTQLKEHGYFTCSIDKSHKNFNNNMKKATYHEMIQRFWTYRYNWDCYLSLIQREYVLNNPEYFGISKPTISEKGIHDSKTSFLLIDTDDDNKLPISEYRSNEDHAKMITNLLLKHYYNQGDYIHIEMLLKEYLTKSVTLLGRGHLDTIKHTNQLADLYFEHKKYDKAEKLYEENFKIIKFKYNNNHPDLLAMKTKLLAIYKQQGKYLKASALNLNMK